MPTTGSVLLGQAREEPIPPLVADRFWHIGQQPLMLPGWLPVIFLWEAHAFN